MDSQASEQEPRPEQTDDPITPPVQPFPLVGIGASAGGLQALQQFFAHAREQCRRGAPAFYADVGAAGDRNTAGRTRH